MVYLDNAATSFIKPPSVQRAMLDAIEKCASVGRGGHAAAQAAQERVFSARQSAAKLFGLSNPARVCFTYNATTALNMAIKALARTGRIVLSGYEHNAAARPARTLSRREGCECVVAASPLFDPDAMVSAFREAIVPGTVLCVLCHVSNVFGAIAPVKEIDALCCEKGVPLVIDASQSAGLINPDVSSLRAAQFICMPGHKALYGPQGTGILLHIGDEPTETLIEGGTGSDSAKLAQPAFDPDRFESGTHNVPGIAGLDAGIRFVLTKGPENLLKHERTLSLHAMRELSRLDGVHVFIPPDESLFSGVFSFTLDNRECEDAARVLSSAGIAVRAGLHCAPLAHRSAGTFPAGTIRVSPGAFTTAEDMERLVRAVRTMSKR